VFISAPDRANLLAAQLAKTERFASATDFPAWIDENFGENWQLSKIVGSGIALHHGRIPRAMASHFIRMFNTGELPILICTSTIDP
jgi:replicative superfamily II helicase